MRKKYAAGVLCASVILLSACGQPVDKIHKSMEETVAIEKDFEKQQKPLMKLEAKEKEMYDEMMKLGKKEMKKISSIADDALANLDKREELMNKEEKAMEDSKSEFSNVDGYVDKLEDEKLKKEAKDLKGLMEERYKAHEKLVKAYKSSIKENRSLYKMMKKKDLELQEVERQVESANKAQEIVVKENESFNELTEKYNKAKKDFYKKSEEK